MKIYQENSSAETWEISMSFLIVFDNAKCVAADIVLS